MLIPVLCPTPNGVVLVQEFGTTTTQYQMSLVNYQVNNLPQNGLVSQNFSSASGATNFVVQFTVSSNYDYSFVVTMNQAMTLAFQLWTTTSSSSCYRTQTWGCTGLQTCNQVISLNPGTYTLVVADNNAFTPSFQNYNVLINITAGNDNCRNISNQLSYCAGQLSGLYDITAISITNNENTAQNNFNSLVTVYRSGSTTSCNSTILNYVCNSAFQKSLCSANGQTGQTTYCGSQCVSTLNAACGDNTLCAQPVCNQISPLSCNTPNGPTPVKGSGSIPMLSVGFLFLLGIVLRCL